MRLITHLVFLGLLCLAPCTATSIAKAGCGGADSVSVNGPASCFSGGSSAFAGPFAVAVFATGPKGTNFGGFASYETDAYLTTTGGTGPGYASIFFGFNLSAEVQDNGTLQAKINGFQNFYFDSSRFGGGNKDVSLIYGEPVLLHIELLAIVSSNARPNSPDTLIGFLTISSILTDVEGARAVLVEVPEPRYGLLAGMVLLGWLAMAKIQAAIPS